MRLFLTVLKLKGRTHTHRLCKHECCDWKKHTFTFISWLYAYSSQEFFKAGFTGSGRKRRQPGMCFVCVCVWGRDAGNTSKPGVGLGRSTMANKQCKVLQGWAGNSDTGLCQCAILVWPPQKTPLIFHAVNWSKQTNNKTAELWTNCSTEWRLFAALAHRVQGLQRGRPLDAHAGLRPARRAWGGRADPGGGGYAELLHAAGAASFDQSANTVQTDGREETAQEELRPPIQLSVHKAEIHFERQQWGGKIYIYFKNILRSVNICFLLWDLSPYYEWPLRSNAFHYQ